MDPHVVAELTKLKGDKQLPINTKWAKLKETMVQAGLAWPRTEVPSQVLCHPKNRAGIMLNAWDVHAKGAKMLELGIAMNKIQESVAFEVSTKGSTKQQQLQANIQLVESSHNQLAPVTGQERLLSCSSSHLVAFCRAVLHGCQTQEPSLKAKTNGQLSLAALANSQDGLVTMCEQGWTWLVVSSLVEEAFPDLPTLVQQALNTTQAVSQGQGECETMLTIATHYQHGQDSNGSGDMAQAIQLAASSQPEGSNYMQTMGYYVQNFSGGVGWPLLHLLQHISSWASLAANICLGKQFSTTLKLGEEYFSTVAYLDFKEKSSSMPWVRAALLAANLSAPRSIDGIAKCLTKADCEKLKSKHQKALVIQCESMLAMNWATLQGKPWKDTPKAYNLMGRCMVRMALHIAKKETKGRDTKNYESLAEISTLFSEELLEVEAAPGAPSVEPDAADPAKLAMKTYRVEPGCHYTYKAKDSKIADPRVWKLQHVGPDKSNFEHQPLIGPAVGLEVENEDLKRFRKFDRDLPVLVPTATLEKLHPSQSEQLLKEAMKAEAQQILCQHYQEKVKLDADSLLVAQNFNGILANKSFGKGKLVLFPVGPVAVVKEVKASMLTMTSPLGQELQILAPKLDPKEGTGCLVPYFHVRPTPEQSLANMEPFVAKSSNWQIPGYKNSTKIDIGDQLLFYKDKDKEKDKKEEEATVSPPAKRAKAGRT
ncbi:unnamed protein product [Cladocopium goreaui]|uniref:Uncharacterized protein n=1 Tax=Cladocopium goreaui TaxID=2562237 RepID=A0A9P1CMA9_9DINO|nr:unnamed protein product [Cladocopium goreaui]